MTTISRTFVATLIIAVWATGAHAQDEKSPDAQDAEPSDAQEKSQKLFQQAAEHYREGRFSVAATLLEESYGLYSEPIILYNLGRAHESDGRGQEAIDAYTRYLAVGERTDKAGVEARVARLRKRLEKDAELEELRAKQEEAREVKKTREQLPAEVVVPPTSPKPLDYSSRDDENRSLVGPAIIATIGVVVLAGSGGTAFLASREFDNAENAIGQKEAVRKKDRADSLALGANIGFGVGGAALAAGAIWALVRSRGGASPREQNEQRNVRINVSPSGIVLSGHFDWPLK